MSDLNPLRQIESTSSNDATQLLEHFKQISFAACIKFAFDMNNTGVISELLGKKSFIRKLYKDQKLINPKVFTFRP